MCYLLLKLVWRWKDNSKNNYNNLLMDTQDVNSDYKNIKLAGESKNVELQYVFSIRLFST